MLFGNIIAFYFESYETKENARCVKDAEFYNVKASGTYRS
jgi:hypothetical protein